MQLKVLILPFFIIMMLVLLIGFIKPDYDVIQVNKLTLADKKDKVENMEMIIANISSLNSSLDTQQDFEKRLFRYFPDTINQDRVIDAFNVFAIQSGVVITEMEFNQSIVQPVIIEDTSGVISDAPQMALPPVPKTFIFSGAVVGSYENIKTFFDYLSHMERFQKVNLFSIEADTVNEKFDANQLKGTFETEIAYLPAQPVISALNVPIFRNAKFDFSNVNKLLEQAKSVVPNLEKGQTGRPNPFLQ